MAIGFILNFFGIRFFRFVIGVTAFIIFAVAGYVILINIHLHHYNFEGNFDKIILAGTALSGTIGAALSGCLWRWILLGVGAFGGVSLGLALFSALSSTINSDIPVWVRPVGLGAFAITGALLLKRFERPIIIFATAITGSLLLAFGFDTFIATGFDLIILATLSGSMDPSKLVIKENKAIGMVLFWIGMTIVGVFAQASFAGKNIRSHTKK